MKAYVITLEGHAYSERKAARCIESAAHFDVEVEKFPAVRAEDAEGVMRDAGLEWTWAQNNTAHDVCPITGLKQHPYGNLHKKIACSMSHYLLWQKCIEEGEILILEHDAVFIAPMPRVVHGGICQINDPKGATPRGEWWSEQMAKRGPGVFNKTRVWEDSRPDGLAGNSAYLIKPEVAQGAINAFRELGVWPNDATLCRQLFYLEELYPFVTRVEQELSTTT